MFDAYEATMVTYFNRHVTQLKVRIYVNFLCIAEAQHSD